MNSFKQSASVLAASILSVMTLDASPGTWQGLPAEILESPSLRAVILPEQGGSLASLQSIQHDNKEWLWALPQKKRSWSKEMPDSYDLSGGIEDSFPTLGAVISINPDEAVPFFGSVWNKPWQVTKSSARHLTCTYHSREPAYQLEKSWSLQGNRLKIRYRWTNTGTKPLEAIWVAHALFRMDENTRLDLPEGTPLRIHSWIKNGQEKYGGNIKWPKFDLENPARDLSRLSTRTTGRSDKLFVMDMKGMSIDLRHEDGTALHLTFGKGVESIGLWINQKAFPFTGEKYSIIGIEPATSAYEALDEAKKHNKAMILQPGKSQTWEYQIEAK